MKDTMLKRETVLTLSDALDALWGEVGNGFGTEDQRLIEELQRTIERENLRFQESVKTQTAQILNDLTHEKAVEQ